MNGVRRAPGASDQPSGGPADGRRPSEPAPRQAPGDEAPSGSPGTGEATCPRCGGTGRLDGGRCPDCEGRGTVTVQIGGA